uniref:Uncharacterized protein n=1 Tax=Romanomermis culicivorax TaxID=13658 RepID=A0A915J018_ROMCU
MVLSAPEALPILGPDVARRVLEFIADGTILATPVDKILGRRLRRCGGSQSQRRPAHSSCCHITDNNEDGSPNTGGNCSIATGRQRIWRTVAHHQQPHQRHRGVTISDGNRPTVPEDWRSSRSPPVRRPGHQLPRRGPSMVR